MRKVSFIQTLVSSVAVLAIIFSSCTQKQQSVSNEVVAPVSNAKVARVVYLNTDTLMSQYLLAVELNEAFLKKQEETTKKLSFCKKQCF